MIIGAALGALGALVGATGQSISQMIAAGVLMGLGGGFQEIVFACVQVGAACAKCYREPF